jgi:hypothetical protein
LVNVIRLPRLLGRLRTTMSLLPAERHRLRRDFAHKRLSSLNPSFGRAERRIVCPERFAQRRKVAGK